MFGCGDGQKEICGRVVEDPVLLAARSASWQRVFEFIPLLEEVHVVMNSSQ
jgi:hypothetical protein